MNIVTCVWVHGVAGPHICCGRVDLNHILDDCPCCIVYTVLSWATAILYWFTQETDSPLSTHWKHPIVYPLHFHGKCLGQYNQDLYELGIIQPGVPGLLHSWYNWLVWTSLHTYMTHSYCRCSNYASFLILRQKSIQKLISSSASHTEAWSCVCQCITGAFNVT